MLIAAQIIGGLILLFIGGEGLVRGAVSFARILKIPAVVIGLTIVAYGTSTPELVVSTMAAMEGKPDIAIGNIVGSNICNILLILGLAAFISPIINNPKLAKRDGSIMIAVSVLLIGMMWDGMISRLEGGILFALIVAYTWNTFAGAKKRDTKAQAQADENVDIEIPDAHDPMWKSILFMFGGLALLVAGSNYLIEGSVAFARILGVSEAVIGLTIVAVGTSTPELVTSVIAAIKKHADIAVANVVGSNIFNIIGILGITGLISPIPVSSHFMVLDVWVMLAVAVLLTILMMTMKTLGRVTGFVGIALFTAYTVYLYMGTQAATSVAGAL
jgi:cation:H+ antiporter